MPSLHKIKIEFCGKSAFADLAVARYRRGRYPFLTLAPGFSFHPCAMRPDLPGTIPVSGLSFGNRQGVPQNEEGCREIVSPLLE